MALGNPVAARTPGDRRRRNRDQMVADILGAARQVMREDGVAALSLNEIARRVGVRAPSLYEYFESKNALYDALFLVGVRLWAERVARLLDSEYGSPWELLRAIFEAYVDFGDDHPEMYMLIHERHVPGFEPSPESLAESVRLTELGVKALRPWIDQKALVTELSPEEAFDLVIVVLRGLAGGHVANEPGERSPTSRIRRLIPAAVDLFRAAWSPGTPAAAGSTRRVKQRGDDGRTRREGGRS